MTLPFLSDGVVSLRPIRREDLSLLADWRNQPDLRMRVRGWWPLTTAHQERWWERITSEETHDFMFCIWANRRPVGVVGLCHWDPQARVAESSFYVGPEPQRRKGYARRALTLLHQWGFETIIERAWAESFAFNEPSIRLLRSLGYVEEGRFREHVYRDGRRWDSVLLGLLKREWDAREAADAGKGG